MKKLIIILFFPLFLQACGDKYDRRLTGQWLDVRPTGSGQSEGFCLQSEGKAYAIGKAGVEYTDWKCHRKKLILRGHRTDTEHHLQFSDTLRILRITPDTLFLEDMKGLPRTFFRTERTRNLGEITSDSVSNAPGKATVSIEREHVVQTLKGQICVAHEVRCFKPEGQNLEYWFVDKTQSVEKAYAKLMSGVEDGRPVQAELEVEYSGKSADGFAAEYAGVFVVRKLISMYK